MRGPLDRRSRTNPCVRELEREHSGDAGDPQSTEQHPEDVRDAVPVSEGLADLFASFEAGHPEGPVSRQAGRLYEGPDRQTH